MTMSFHDKPHHSAVQNEGNVLILHTKIQIPLPQKSLVVRTRLLQKLDQGAEKGKLTAICSAAGYGKTTLVSTWIRDRQQLAAWVSLDAKDNDLIHFWSYVVAAINQIDAGLTARLSPILMSMNPSSFETGLIFLLNECYRYFNSIVLVLDDYHSIYLPEIHTSLEYFIERLPANVHVVLLSRSPVPFKLSKLMAAGQLNDLSLSDLKFTQEEADDFYRQKMDLAVPSDITRQWTFRTEGWAAGMQLTALCAQRNAAEGILWELRGEERPIADYLWEEVFMQQTESVQSFLLNTSVLDRLCASVCDLLTGQQDGQDMLERLEQNHMFLIPLDLRKGWYRYHHLFSEFLRKQLERRNLAAVSNLHAVAAVWLEAEGYEEEAIEHYLVGNRMNEAALLITRHLPSKIKQEWNTLSRWIDAVPEQILIEHPILYVSKIFLAALFRDFTEANRQFQIAEALYAQQHEYWPLEQAEKFYTELLLMKAILAYGKKDLETTAVCLREYAERAKEESPFIAAHGNDQFVSVLRYYPGLEGKLRMAESYFSQFIGLLQGGPSVVTALFAIGYAEVLYERNRLEEAKSYADHYLQIGKELNSKGMIVLMAVLLSRILKAQGEAQLALSALADARSYPGIAGKPLWSMMLDVQKVRLQLDGGTGVTVEKEGLHTIPPSGWMEHYQINWNMYVSLTLVRALLKSGQSEQALAWLDQLWEEANLNGWLMDRIEILLLQSCAWQQKEDINCAVSCLSHALQLGEPEGYIRTFIDEGEPVARLLMEYLQRRQKNHIRHSEGVPLSYVKLLVSEFRFAVSEAEGNVPQILIKLTKKEREVLELIEAGLSNSGIATKLNIGIGTVKTHINRLYGKLHVNSRVEALQRCREWKLL